LLLEADLRHPTLAQQHLDLRAGAGLADVLIGAVSFEEAAQSLVPEAGLGGGASGQQLDVLTAGTVLPPNPAELLESRAMAALLDRVRFEYDLVVIDAPPLTAVSDAFPLVRTVDGVVVVSWVAKSRRDAAEELHRVLADTGASVLGLIANGSKAVSPGSYVDTTNTQAASVIASTNGSSPSEQLLPTAKH
jgi:receptor protein-tyrosine kinase